MLARGALRAGCLRGHLGLERGPSVVRGRQRGLLRSHGSEEVDLSSARRVIVAHLVAVQLAAQLGRLSVTAELGRSRTLHLELVAEERALVRPLVREALPVTCARLDFPLSSAPRTENTTHLLSLVLPHELLHLLLEVGDARACRAGRAGPIAVVNIAGGRHAAGVGVQPAAS